MTFNPYFYELAKISSNSAAEHGVIVDSKWIYAQWHIETGGFTSNLQASHHNLGGITSTSGDWMYFDNFIDFANYFGRYLAYYSEDGIQNSTSLYEYLSALQHGGYFTVDLHVYYEACMQIISTILS